MHTIILAVFFYVGDIRHWTWKFINNSLIIQRYFSNVCLMEENFRDLHATIHLKYDAIPPLGFVYFHAKIHHWWDELNDFTLFSFSQMQWKKSNALKEWNTIPSESTMKVVARNRYLSGRLRFFSLIILVINCISSHKIFTFSEECEAATQRSCSLRQVEFLRRTWLRHDYIQRSQASWLFLFYLVQSPVTQDIVTVAWNYKFHHTEQKFIKRTFKYGSCY